MQLCRTIYYSIDPWLLNMFRAIILLETCRAVKEQLFSLHQDFIETFHKSYRNDQQDATM